MMAEFSEGTGEQSGLNSFGYLLSPLDRSGAIASTPRNHNRVLRPTGLREFAAFHPSPPRLVDLPLARGTAALLTDNPCHHPGEHFSIKGERREHDDAGAGREIKPVYDVELGGRNAPDQAHVVRELLVKTCVLVPGW